MGAAPNPCTAICKFDEGLCLSCGRLRAEKKQWKRLDKSQKKEILARSAERLEALGDRAILSKKQRKKERATARAPETGQSNGMVVNFRPPQEAAVTTTPTQPPQNPIIDPEAAKAARKAWKKARKHARKAKKAARKARAAEARARGLTAA